MNIVWFRNDLRLHDNPALWQGAQAGSTVAIFYLTPKQWRGHDMAACRVDFLLRSLKALRKDLRSLGIPLVVRQAGYFDDAVIDLVAASNRWQAKAVYWNDEYPVDERERDQRAEKALRGQGVEVHRYHDRVLTPPGAVLKSNGEPYQVFTPFKKALMNLMMDGAPDLLPPPEKQRAPKIEDVEEIPETLSGFESDIPADLWPAGEKEARERLRQFGDEGLDGYHNQRDLPAIEGTSRLSPYLAIGAISPQQCLTEAMLARGEGAKTWINELVWRDFYQHIAWHFPHVCKNRPFREETEAVSWRNSDKDFELWCEGRTGVPLVDAGMRQLRQTGWMHNRVRMVVAMFLSKNLLLDWRRGEQYFMSHLIDGDFCANNGGWQWSASTGTDAAPYFRIFNPFTQGQRFDPDGHYIKTFVPELKDVEAKHLHDPEKLARNRPEDYPELMVDLAVSRERAIAAFKDSK